MDRLTVPIAVVSKMVWLALKATVGLRLSEADEAMGVDRVEFGMIAYPEFGSVSEGV